MTSEIDARAKEVESALATVRQSPTTENIHDVEVLLDFYRMELRTLPHHQLAIYKEKLRTYRTTLKSNTMVEDSPGLNTSSEVIAHGNSVQEETIKSLVRTTQVLAETKVIAVDITLKVSADTEKIEECVDDLYTIDDSLARSVVIIKRIGRGVFSNKYLWGLIVLCVIGAIVCIVLSVKK